MTEERRSICPDCESGLSRREFARVVGGAAMLAGGAGALVPAVRTAAAPTPDSAAETGVKRFYDSLDRKQKEAICFPFEHEKRTRISANWKITEPRIADEFYSDQQRRLIDEIFRGVTSPDGYQRFQQQTKDDAGGFQRYHVAVFGTPGSGKFQWELTGRHLTIRADGDSVPGAAFGGPIVYGHGKGNPSANLFHYQTKRANDVFEALDAAQRERALLAEAPPESAVPVQGSGGNFSGIAVSELSADQIDLVQSVIKVVLAPYRQADIDEALAVLKAGGGPDGLRMSFYREGDLGDDNVWDIWRVEGPSFVCHFRGAPHVHAYINVARPAQVVRRRDR